MRRLIVTADDFGASAAVNAAVERGYLEGVLTTASLMVGAKAAADAVTRSRRLPGLRVGLHVVLVCGRPVLHPDEVPSLVDGNGMFSGSLARAGCNFFFRPAVRRQLRMEIRAQFEAFRSTGLSLDHVNAHNHMHLHPTVMASILEVGRDFGLRAVRLPYEPPGAPGSGALGAAALRAWVAVLRGQLDRAGIGHNDYLFGLGASGHMTAATVRSIIETLPSGTSEIYFHPAVTRERQPFPRDYAPDAEFAALVDPEIKAMIERAGVHRISFSDLGAVPRG